MEAAFLGVSSGILGASVNCLGQEEREEKRGVSEGLC